MRVYEFCECVFVAFRASCEKNKFKKTTTVTTNYYYFLFFSLTDASILEVNVESFSLMNAHLHFIFRNYIYISGIYYFIHFLFATK